MKVAIDETYRRRSIQEAYNREHGITPQSIRKAIRDITDRVNAVAEARVPYETAPVSRDQIAVLIKDLETQMKNAARTLEFEKAALLRDRIIDLKKELVVFQPIEAGIQENVTSHNSENRRRGPVKSHRKVIK